MDFFLVFRGATNFPKSISTQNLANECKKIKGFSATAAQFIEAAAPPGAPPASAET